MTGKAASFGLPYLAAIAGVAGYFFHAALRGGGSSVPLIAFSILMCLLFLLAAAALDKQEAYADVYRKLPSDTALSPVSYTHLVAAYKKDKEGYTDNVFVEVKDNDMHMYVQKEVVDDVLTPVSYTHLDVYKRQI